MQAADEILYGNTPPRNVCPWPKADMHVLDSGGWEIRMPDKSVIEARSISDATVAARRALITADGGELNIFNRSGHLIETQRVSAISRTSLD